MTRQQKRHNAALDKLHRKRLSETTENGKYDPPPAICLAPDVRKTHTAEQRDVDAHSPLLSLDWDNLEAMSVAPRHRSIRSPEARLAARMVTTWLNGERVGSEAVPGSLEYRAWGNTRTSRGRILALLAQVRIALNHAHDVRSNYGVDERVPLLPLDVFDQMSPYATTPLPVLHIQSGRIGLRQHPVSRRYPHGEVLAAHGLMTLIQCDGITLLRQCSLRDCGRWFFAPRDLSWTCPGGVCGQRARDQMEENKQRRRDNAEHRKRMAASKRSGRR